VMHLSNDSVWSRTALVLSAALFLGLASCADKPVPPPSAPVGFGDRPPLTFTVKSIEMIDAYVPLGRPPNIDHEFPTRASQVVAHWVSDRLRHTDGDAELRVTLVDGAVIETVVKKSAGLVGVVKDQQSRRYDATVTVRLEMVEAGTVRVWTEGTTRRSRTVADSLTLAERDRVFDQFMWSLGRDLDRVLEQQIRAHFGAYLK